MRIGFFDSGLGGLSVLHSAFGMIPCRNYIYYADEKNVPYGEKSREQIISFTDDAVSFMIEKGADAIVIACNTATSCAINFLREKYGEKTPIVGMEPAVKPAVENNSLGKRVLVTATPVTVREQKLARLIERVDTNHAADTLALPELVRFAERLEFSTEKVKSYLAEKLGAYKLDSYSSLVLGCTHFNYFKDTLSMLLPHGVMLVDGCEGTVRHLAELMNIPFGKGADNPQVEYYFSGRACNEAELERINILHSRLAQMEKITKS